MNDRITTIGEMKNLMQQFIQERGWTAHQDPRNVAASIAIEAAELLEHFQWNNPKPEDKIEVARELADIVAYVLSFGITYDIDIAAAFAEKMERNAEKYPAAKVKEHSLNGYYEIKQTTRLKK